MSTKTKVKELMTTNVVAFKPGDKIRYVTETFRRNKISGAPVIDDQRKVIGVISEADIMKLTATIPPPDIDLDLFNPIEFFSTFSYMRKAKKIPDEIEKQCETLFEGCAEDVMSKKPVTASPDDSISDVARVMHKNDFNRLPVVDDRRRLLGIIARDDVIGVFVKRNEKG
jgi:CBS domain-containing protein